MKHGRITTFEPQPDGSVNIRSEGYGESLNTITEEVMQNVISTRETLMADYVNCLRAVTEKGTRELQVTVRRNYDNTFRITKIYQTRRKKL